MSAGAYVQAIQAHGCGGLKVSHFIAVTVLLAGAKTIFLPAVVDDFGDLVIVGGPL